MKVLVADKLAKAGLDALRNAGLEVIVEASAKGDALAVALRERQPEALVVRSTKVPPDAIDASSALELIVRAGAGFDNIDVEHASARGVFVANCPGKNAIAVAELTLGLLLAIDRRLPENVADAREGKWNKAEYSKASGVMGRTLGLVGLGSIGREVASRAQSFGLEVIGYSRSLTREAAASLNVTRLETPLEVAAHSDIVSVHLASNAQTRGLIGRDFFEQMRDGAIFINTSRADIVDEEALIWAVEQKGIRAGLDVMSDEPAAKEGPFEHSLAGHPHVYFSHHIGASTDQAQDATALEAARIIRGYAESGRVDNCINMEEHSPATAQITVRHLDRVGVLAAILNTLSEAGCNVQEMENLIFRGAKAACAIIRFDGPSPDSLVHKIGKLPNVIAVKAISLES